MTQIAVHLNTPITTNLRADCLGGEWRWERQVLEALLQDARFDRVYSLYPVWQSSEPMPDKFIDGLPASEEANTICLAHDSYHIVDKHRFKGLAIQIHQPTQSLARFVEMYGERFFVTYDRAIRTLEDGVHARLVRAASEDHVENIANPSVPSVHENNNFDANILLFPAKAPVLPRGVIDALKQPSFEWGDLFGWCARRLRVDSTKELHFLTGYQQADLDFIHCTNLCEDFFRAPATQPLLGVSNRVVLHRAMSWSSVLDLYARTKVVVSTLSTGGSPLEAGSFGIPVIGPASSPIGQFEEFLVADCLSPRYFELTDRLYYDRDFYTYVGNAYREHVRKHYTYGAYVDNLVRILQKRGLMSC